MTTYSEEFQKRMNDMSDKHTIAWWNEQLQEIKKGYRGATHAINRCHDDYKGNQEEIVELRDRIEGLAEDRDAANAKIGELQAEIVALKQWQERAGEFLNELRKERTNGVAT